MMILFFIIFYAFIPISIVFYEESIWNAYLSTANKITKFPCT